MIEKGSTIRLETRDRTSWKVYALCEVVFLSSQSLTIRYAESVKFDKETGKHVPHMVEETIPRHKVLKMSERL